MNDTLDIIVDITVSEPQHAKSLFRQVSVAPGIRLDRQIVGISVKLDDKLGLSAKEIAEIRTNLHLAAELMAKFAGAKVLPESALLRRSLITQFASTVRVPLAPLRH